MVPVYIATGAFDCGKTTTLEWLREHHGLRIHGEAHLRALASWGDRTAGHPPDRGFTRIEDPEHSCPMCRPRAFAERVLEEQRAIEGSAQPGDILERGYLDPIEMLLRNSGGPRPAWTPIARYARVFLFEVMPALQRPRWGKSVERRIAEAQAINERLERMYGEAGHEVVRIGPGAVEARAARLRVHLTP
ncbi:hypothetical protein ENSA5_43330 [Enhygromyxa salina]|uniref:NadR/Ttd14 AAA domain-containing protein n=1 Tax=Enhygromyxa salina TaxID=215803 RepID=A0A2S9XKV2_9BACT|nr:ATP-binding protein [Enhygromyxa salina]PRP93311.1 hypothetical protein ENSA5_43330 [Enhygromyxa salina]